VFIPRIQRDVVKPYGIEELSKTLYSVFEISGVSIKMYKYTHQIAVADISWI